MLQIDEGSIYLSENIYRSSGGNELSDLLRPRCGNQHRSLSVTLAHPPPPYLDKFSTRESLQSVMVFMVSPSPLYCRGGVFLMNSAERIICTRVSPKCDGIHGVPVSPLLSKRRVSDEKRREDNLKQLPCSRNPLTVKNVEMINLKRRQTL